MDGNRAAKALIAQFCFSTPGPEVHASKFTTFEIPGIQKAFIPGSNQYWTPVHIMPTIDTEQTNSITRSSSGESHDRSHPISSPTAKVCHVRTAAHWRVAPSCTGPLRNRHHGGRIGDIISKCPEVEHGAKFADGITIAAIQSSRAAAPPQPAKSGDNSASQSGSISLVFDGRTGHRNPLKNRAARITEISDRAFLETRPTLRRQLLSCAL